MTKEKTEHTEKISQGANNEDKDNKKNFVMHLTNLKNKRDCSEKLKVSLHLMIKRMACI